MFKNLFAGKRGTPRLTIADLARIQKDADETAKAAGPLRVFGVVLGDQCEQFFINRAHAGFTKALKEYADEGKKFLGFVAVTADDDGYINKFDDENRPTLKLLFAAVHEAQITDETLCVQRRSRSQVAEQLLSGAQLDAAFVHAFSSVPAHVEIFVIFDTPRGYRVGWAGRNQEAETEQWMN